MVSDRGSFIYGKWTKRKKEKGGAQAGCQGEYNVGGWVRESWGVKKVESQGVDGGAEEGSKARLQNLIMGGREGNADSFPWVGGGTFSRVFERGAKGEKKGESCARLKTWYSEGVLMLPKVTLILK